MDLGRERLTIEEVSEILGMSTQQIRTLVRGNRFDPPICRVVHGNKNDHYLFFRKLVENYVGLSSMQKL